MPTPPVVPNRPPGKPAVPPPPAQAPIMAQAMPDLPGEAGEGEQVRKTFWQLPFVQDVLPFLTSLTLHIGLIGLIFATVKAIEVFVKPTVEEQVVVPTAGLEEGPVGGVPHPGLGGDPTKDAAQDKFPEVGKDATGWAEKPSQTMSESLMGGGAGDSGGESVIGIGGSGTGKGTGLGAGTGTGFGSGTGDGSGPLAPFGIPGGGGGLGPKSTFIGVSGNARFIAYVCDASGSMVGKFDDLRFELRKSITNLRPTQAFNVIFFAQDQNIGPVTHSKDNLVLASPEHKEKAIKFLESTVAMRQTWVIPAIELAFKQKPQLIYLLTDGEFNEEKDQVIAKINTLNKDRKVRINTIAFVDRGDQYEKVLKEIAQANGGVFKYVSESDLGRR